MLLVPLRHGTLLPDVKMGLVLDRMRERAAESKLLAALRQEGNWLEENLVLALSFPPSPGTGHPCRGRGPRAYSTDRDSVYLLLRGTWATPSSPIAVRVANVIPVAVPLQHLQHFCEV